MQARDRPRDRVGDRLGWLAASTCVVSGASLLLQYALLVHATLDTIGPLAATVRFLSYFTILANLQVVLVTGATLRMRGDAAGFLASGRVRGAAALYIGVTGLIYVTVLRHLWQPQGAQWWADTGLHDATPLLYLAWWLFGARHGALDWRDIGGWLLFPLAYLSWCFARGAWIQHEYPYPFIDFAALGWTAVLRNAFFVLLVFLALGVLLVAIDRGLRPRSG
jgi:hypothetical protein